jgi:integrase
MRRMIGRLTELQVQRAGKGWHNDGGGLYLRIEGRQQRWWVFRYGAGGKHYHGLGPLHTIGLAEARERARQCRKLLLDGADPISAGKARRAAVALEAANAKTFAQCVDAYYDAHCAAWTNHKHAREWKASLKAHVLPELGALSVAAIDTAQVMRVLESAWTKIPETATRLRSRIESVLDWAKVKGYRDGENPARWRGHLDHLLPARKKVARVRHHPALPYRELPAFMRRLREHEDVEAHALEFIILTAARAGETVAAVWSEIDQADAAGWTWFVPPERMKARREHRIPLSKAARALLERTLRERRRGYLFPNATQRGKAVTVIALWRLTQELTGGTASTHGFRATFRSWAGEQTNFAREVAELALAHRVGDDTELAYLRGDLLKKRRQLMEAWARYCASPSVTAASDVVVPMGTGRRG